MSLRNGKPPGKKADMFYFDMNTMFKTEYLIAVNHLDTGTLKNKNKT